MLECWMFWTKYTCLRLYCGVIAELNKMQKNYFGPAHKIKQKQTSSWTLRNQYFSTLFVSENQTKYIINFGSSSLTPCRAMEASFLFWDYKIIQSKFMVWQKWLSLTRRGATRTENDAFWLFLFAPGREGQAHHPTLWRALEGRSKLQEEHDTMEDGRPVCCERLASFWRLFHKFGWLFSSS